MLDHCGSAGGTTKGAAGEATATAVTETGAGGAAAAAIAAEIETGTGGAVETMTAATIATGIETDGAAARGLDPDPDRALTE